MITQKELKENLIYEPETGMFTRISNGNFCETKDVQGYIVIKIKRKLYKAHRLAFLYMVIATVLANLPVIVLHSVVLFHMVN